MRIDNVLARSGTLQVRYLAGSEWEASAPLRRLADWLEEPAQQGLTLVAVGIQYSDSGDVTLTAVVE